MSISAVGHSWVDAASGQRLDVWFPQDGSEPVRSCLAQELGLVQGEVVTTEIVNLDDPAVDTADVWLRLHLLSQRKAKPNSINLDGIFGLLTNVAWTSAGPVAPNQVDALRSLAGQKAGGNISVTSVDKFPRMTDYVVPSGVRIGNADRVRLGAYLGEGTTVMHEGFINFNAGTLGVAMVEGRISAGVVVGADSDIGGSASIMGTLSGGGKETISVGENCLLGANSGIGISLGDNCIVEAGLYVTSGTIVAMPDGKNLKASELSGTAGLLYRRNSMTGQVEVLVTDKTDWGGVQSELHAN